MKKILFRKFLFDYITFFLIALISASTIIWVFQAVNFLDIMIEDGRDYLVYVNYSLLNFPKIFSKLLPFILFFSLFYITLKYENSNELIIFWNFGVNKIQLVNFIFITSILLMIIQIVFTAFIVPKSQDKARSFLRTSKINFLGNFIKPQRFNDTITGVTIYAEKKDEEGNLYNLYIKKEIDNVQITYAKKGQFKELNNIPILVLYDGQTVTEQNNEITIFNFSKSDFLLKNFKSNTTLYKKTQELSTINLFRCIFFLNSQKKSEKNNLNSKIENCSKNNFTNIIKEIYKRIFIPIYIPLLMLIPLILITSSKENINYSKLKLVTFSIGLIFIIFSETTIRLISEQIVLNYIIASVPIILLMLIYLIFYKKFNFI